MGERSMNLDDMSDAECVRAIRAHLTRTFIGPVSEKMAEREGPTGVTVSTPVRLPHRYVRVFDELVKGYRRGE